MRYILLLLFIIQLNLVATTAPKVTQKKQNFYNKLVPVIDKVYFTLLKQHKITTDHIKNNIEHEKVEKLRKRYRVDNNKDLLLALKPHPRSIAIAQAAMESAWGRSRFFREANNIFGMWSSNKNEPRVAANIKRAGGRVIWLRKFNSLEESIKAYYFLIATGKAFNEFREIRSQTDDVYKIVKKLDKYSEIGEQYTQELAKMIRYNQLTKYDR
jgi:Bax protein